MEIIDRLEGGPRGVYSGSIGFISFNDTFDLNIVIRTAIVDVPRDAVAIGAGGAIVVQSSEESEFEEMLLKARALLGVVGRLDAAATATSATSSSPQFKLLSTDGAAATTQTTGGGGLDRSLRLAASSAAAFGSAPPAEVRGS